MIRDREGLNGSDESGYGWCLEDRIFGWIGGSESPIGGLPKQGRRSTGGRRFGGVNATRRRFFLSCGHCKGLASSPYPP